MRVLIVEDDPLLGEALATGLRQRGDVVDWLPDGSQADTALQGQPYDAVVLDLGLPGTDGMAWLGRWRARGLTLPVLILTARDGVEQRIAGLDAGADDYLIKPHCGGRTRGPLARDCSAAALAARRRCGHTAHCSTTLRANRCAGRASRWS
jgi:DNA-binding response OmpR family regulator